MSGTTASAAVQLLGSSTIFSTFSLSSSFFDDQMGMGMGMGMGMVM